MPVERPVGHDGANSYYAVVLDRNASKLAVHKVTSGSWGGAIDSTAATINDSTEYTILVERKQRQIKARLVGQTVSIDSGSLSDLEAGETGFFTDKTNVTFGHFTVLDSWQLVAARAALAPGARPAPFRSVPIRAGFRFRPERREAFAGLVEDLRGGGVYITGGTVELTECIIRDNGACSFGAGMFATNADVAIRRCHFRDNYSRSAGGGIAVWDQARVEIYDSLIENNEASDWGGGVCVSAGSARISRSTITGNHAREGGGVNVRFGGLVEFDSSTVWGNRGELGGEEDQQVFLHDGQVEARYSCIPGAAERFGGVDNFGADPRFVDRLARNYRLQPDSPCINTGDPADQPGIGTRDLDGRPRRLAGRIDVGAYEFGFGDYNGDRVVDLSDYNHWAACVSGPEGGPYPDGCEAFDGNADGDVDLADFAQVQPLLGSR